MELMRDAIWTFVSLFPAVIALIIAGYSLKKQLAKKSFAYIVDNQSPAFVLTDSSHASRIRVLFDNHELRTPKTVDVTLLNDGSFPIVAADFVAPLRISFPEGVRLFNVQIVDAHPGDLMAEPSMQRNSVTIAPLLLNPQDRLVLRFLYEAHDNDEVALAARISGISKIRRIEERDRLTKKGIAVNLDLWDITKAFVLTIAILLLPLKVFGDGDLMQRIWLTVRALF